MEHTTRSPLSLIDKTNSFLTEDPAGYISNFYPIDCSLGYNPFGSSPRAMEWISRYQGESLCRYYDFSTTVELAIVIGEYLGFNPENVFSTNGSFNALSILFYKLFNRPNKRMLGVGPQFVSAVAEWKYSGGEYTSIPLDLHGTATSFLPIDQIIKELNTNSYDVFYLDNPNNPTGYFFSPDEVLCLADQCAKTETFLLIDEAYADYLPSKQSAVHLIEKFKNILVVRSLSKGLGLAAARCGYICVHQTYAELLRKIVPPFAPSLVTTKLSIETLKDKEYLARSNKLTKEFKERLTNLLHEFHITTLPSDVSTPIMTLYKKDSDISALLSKIGILTESGSHFHITRSDFGESYCRIRIPGQLYDFDHFRYRLESQARLTSKN